MINHQEDHHEADGRESEASSAQSFEYACGIVAGDDPSIGHPAEGEHGNSQGEECGTAYQGHRLQRKTSLAHEIKRQPGDQEIPEIVEAEQTYKSAPCGTLSQDFDDARRV